MQDDSVCGCGIYDSVYLSSSDAALIRLQLSGERPADFAVYIGPYCRDGFVWASYFEFQRQYPAGYVRNLVFSMVFMLMSGIFTPIESMPKWAEMITYANPLRYYADAMRSIYLKGGGLSDTWFDLACLMGIGSVTTLCAIKSYRKTS